jgi:hypothetical protein
MNQPQMTKVMLREVNHLLVEVSSFMKSCCVPYSGNELTAFDIDGPVSMGVTSEKSMRMQINDSLPDLYADTLFCPLTTEMQVPLPYYMPDDFEDFDDDDDDEDDDDDNNTSNDSVVERLQVKMEETEEMEDKKPLFHVPIKLDAKNQRRYMCDKCGKSWAYRKGVAYHKAKGKCSLEPRWIRWTRGRPLCIHPDCAGRPDVEYTYSAMMRHIIDVHATPETSVSCLICYCYL